MTRSADEEQIAGAILAFAVERGRDKSLCPSEVARMLASDWRPLMPVIRKVAAAMPQIETRQKSVAVGLHAARGPIRLALK